MPVLFKDLIVLLIAFWKFNIEKQYTCSFRDVSKKMYFKKYNLFSMHPKTKYSCTERIVLLFLFLGVFPVNISLNS